MSLLGSIGSAIKGGVGGFLSGGPAGAVMGALGGAMKNQTSAAPRSAMKQTGIVSLPSTNALSASNIVRRATPVLTKVGGAISRNTGAIGTAMVVGGLLYDAAGNLIGRAPKRRRMNVSNMRAARRAIRRIKGARKMLMAIERQLPKQRTAARRTTRANASDFIQLRNS